MPRTELSFRVFWHAPDAEWVGICEQFPSLSHLDITPQAALIGIQDLIADVIEDLHEHGEPMPWQVSELPPARTALSASAAESLGNTII